MMPTRRTEPSHCHHAERKKARRARLQLAGLSIMP
jgi:hypothetical protein